MNLRLLKILLSLMLMLQTAYGQNTVSSIFAQKKRALELSMIEDAKKTLSAQLETGSYLISVKATLDDKKILTASGATKELPLLALQRKLKREDILRQFSDTVSADELRGYTKSIAVNLTLDTEISADVETALLALLENALSLNSNSGEKISVKRVRLGNLSLRKSQEKSDLLSRDLQKIEDEKRTTELKATSLETMLRSAESQASQLKRESQAAQDELKRHQDELRRQQDELKRAQEELNTTKRQLAEIENPDDQTFIGKLKRRIKGIELVAAIVPVSILFVICLIIIAFLYSSGQNKKSRGINDSVKILADAIAKSSQAASSAQKQRTPQKELNNENQKALATTGANDNDPSDAIRGEAEAAWVLLQEDPYPMLSVLKDWLSTSSGIQRFLAFSDGIGFANSRALWQKFPPTEIEALSRSATEPLPKMMAYQTVAQVYRFAEAIRASQPAFFRNLDLQFLIGLTDAELALALSTSPIESAACGLVFISPTRAAKIIGQITKHNPEGLVSLIAKFDKLDEKTALAHVAQIRKNAPTARKEIGFNISGHIAAVFDSASFGDRQTISRAIAQNAPLSEAVRNSVFTMDDVFSLDSETLSELISGLEPEDLGDLVFTLPQNQKGKVASLMSQRAIIGVQEQIKRVQSKPGARKRAEINGQRIQDALREEVKRMSDEGLIDLPSKKKQGAAS